MVVLWAIRHQPQHVSFAVGQVWERAGTSASGRSEGRTPCVLVSVEGATSRRRRDHPGQTDDYFDDEDGVRRLVTAVVDVVRTLGSTASATMVFASESSPASTAAMT